MAADEIELGDRWEHHIRLGAGDENKRAIYIGFVYIAPVVHAILIYGRQSLHGFN